MPNYTYKLIKTGDLVELSMSISDMEEFEKNNVASHERIYHSVTVADPVGLGITKPPADFQKYVLGKVKAGSPGAEAIANRRWGIPREW